MKLRTGSHWAAIFAVASLAPWMGCNRDKAPAPSSELAAVESQAGGPASRQQAIAFVDGYRQGCQAAREQGKPILLFFTAEWCGYCHAMERETLHDPQIVALSNQFVCVRVDADAEPDVCRLFRVRGYPTVQFISPRGAALNRLVGKQPVAQLSLEMQSALEAIARRIDQPPSHAL
ncbi:MAG TPA: thioredoxin family protein [Pirellulales bacterium]